MNTTPNINRSRRRGLLVASLAAAAVAPFAAPASNASAGHQPEVTCDFDADGRSDLATSAPGEATTGGVVISYNNQNGPGVPFMTNDVQMLLPPGGHEAQVRGFGMSLACGDFNADGVDDLAVGAPTSWGTGGNAGEALVGRFYIYDGTQRVGLSGQYRWYTQDNPGLGAQSDQDQGDRFGTALVTGDFDGDGNDDLAIGADGDHDHGKGGSVTVAFGPIGPNLDATVLRSPQSTGVNIDTARFGASLAAGPTGLSNGDDLVVGAPNTGVTDGRGRVLVFAGGTTLAGVLQASSFGVTSNEPYEQFGASVAVGDFNRNGFHGVAIGAPNFSSDVIGAKNTGAVFVAAGTNGGPSAAKGEVFSEPNVGWAPADGDHFGYAVAAVDLDADGSDDLAVGAPLRRVNGADGAGAVVVRMTRATNSGISWDTTHTYYQGLNVMEFPEPYDYFGASLSSIWLVGDQTPDLVIGAPGEGPDNIWPFPGPDVGKVFVGIGWPSNNGGLALSQDVLPGVAFGGSTAVTGDPATVAAFGEGYGWATGA